MLELLSHKPLAAHTIRSFRSLIKQMRESERQDLLSALLVAFLSDGVEDEKMRKALRAAALEHIEQVTERVRNRIEEKEKKKEEEEEEKEEGEESAEERKGKKNKSSFTPLY